MRAWPACSAPASRTGADGTGDAGDAKDTAPKKTDTTLCSMPFTFMETLELCETFGTSRPGAEVEAGGVAREDTPDTSGDGVGAAGASPVGASIVFSAPPESEHVQFHVQSQIHVSGAALGGGAANEACVPQMLKVHAQLQPEPEASPGAGGPVVCSPAALVSLGLLLAPVGELGAGDRLPESPADPLSADESPHVQFHDQSHTQLAAVWSPVSSTLDVAISPQSSARTHTRFQLAPVISSTE